MHEGQTVVRTFAVEELHIRATAENLKSVIQHILRKFDVPVKNIISVTSDNGGNYLMAGKLLHVEDEEVIDDVEDIEGGAADEWLDVDLSTDDDPILSVRCAAHTLQLAVDEAMGMHERVKDIVTAVRGLARFLRTPTNARQLSEAKKPLPVLDVATRWGSTYNMLKSIYGFRQFIASVMDISSQDRGEHGLTDRQWTEVEDILADLEPVYTATVKLQARDLTLGQMLAIWTEATMALKARQTALSRSILQSMETKVQSVMYKDPRRGERLSSLLDYPAFHAAVFADPRFISLLSRPQIAEAKKYLLELWVKLQATRGVEVQQEPEQPQETEAPEDVSEDPFAAFMAKKNSERIEARARRSRNATRRGRAAAAAAASQPQTQGRAKLESIIEEYDSTTDPLPIKANIHKFWEEKTLIWPELYEVAMIVLAIPATQVSVERLFSSLRFILRPQRFKMAGKRLDDIVFLHANPDLLEAVAKEMLCESHGNAEEISGEEDDCG
ncbi:hypothetical protein FOCC_FOCC012462 [Frankliniella occidentalis]|nr:hypothetical protein FOCC_FOCC012462 [Frankliniella occidentalis]